MDRRFWRGAERLAGWARNRVSGAPVPPWLRGRGAATGLRQALSEGRFDDAQSCAETMLRCSPAAFEARMDPGNPLSPGQLPLVLEWLVAVGNRQRAVELARGHEDQLRATARGCLVAETLRLGPPRPALRGGRVDPRAVERQAREGDEPAALVRKLTRRPWRFLLQPELHLLVHNLWYRDRPDRAVRALNRFLSASGLDNVGPAGLATGLANVRFDNTRPRAGGPLVSVIMSAFDSQTSVEYAVGSILGQTYRNLELLVADDASGDGTPRIIAELARRDSRIRCFRSIRNQGTYNVRNQLLERARGELVTFQDADDIAFPSRLERQVERLEDGADMCICNWLRVRPDGQVVFFRDGKASRMAVVSLMARAQLFRRFGPYRSARFGADLEYLRLLERNVPQRRRARLAVPLLFGAWADTSVTRSRDAEALEDGYRSPARRAYSSAIGKPDDDVVRVLRATGNWKEPTGLAPLDASD